MSRRGAPGLDPLALVRALLRLPRVCPPMPAGVRSVLCEGMQPPRVLSAAEAEEYVAHGLP